MSGTARFAVSAFALAGLLGPPHAASAESVCVSAASSVTGPVASVCVPYGDVVQCRTVAQSVANGLVVVVVIACLPAT